MKRKYLFLSPLFLTLLMVSCGNTQGSSTPSSVSPISENEDITSISLIGPRDVEVGKTITLTADAPNHLVNWTSEDDSILTVSDTGVVRGVSSGSCKVRCASKKDDSIFAEMLITVHGRKSEHIELIIEDMTPEFSYDESKKTYTIPLGKSFVVSYRLDDSSEKPLNVSFQLTLPGDASAGIMTLTQLNDHQAEVVANGVITNAAITVKAFYNNEGVEPLVDAKSFNVVDVNEVSMNQVKQKVASSEDKEKTSLVSANLKREKKTIAAGVTNTITSTYDSSIFDSASYLTYTKKDGDKVEKENYFGGMIQYQNVKEYGLFRYGDDKKIENILNVTESNLTEYEGKSKLLFDVSQGQTFYGINGLINGILLGQDSITDNIIGFGNASLYAYASFTLSDDTYTIASTYQDEDNSLSYQAKLVLSLDGEGILGYTFDETVQALNGDKTVYQETLTLTYGEKKEDTLANNPLHLDTSAYFYSSYDLEDFSGKKDPDGRYDFSDLSKYGILSHTTGDTEKYTLTYDHTLILGVTSKDSPLATTNLDSIKAVTKDNTKIGNAVLVGEGIFSVSCLKDSKGNSMPGASSITFTSAGGVTKTIEVEFVAPTLTAIVVGHLDSHTLGEVFVNSSSDYFFLNTNPDDESYEYRLEILTGDADGIELYQNVDGNIDGLPGFSYSIRGLKKGDYTFKFGVVGSEVLSDDVYSIKVVDPYSVSELAAGLVGKKFIYSTGTVDFAVNFTSATQLDFTQTGLLTGSASATYHLETGRVVVDSVQVLDQGTGAFYYHSILDHDIGFAKDFSSVTLYLDTLNQDTSESDGYRPVVFKKYVDKTDFGNYINNKTFTMSDFIVGLGMTNGSVTFANGNGTMVLNSVTITFQYTYDAAARAINLTSVTSSDSIVTFSKNTADVIGNYDSIRFSVNTSSGAQYLYFSVE